MLRCPKCAGKKIWVVEKYRIPGESFEGRPLPVLPHQAEARTGIFQALRQNPIGYFDLVLCGACGYSELWAGGLDKLAADPSLGIRLVDTSDLGEGPFR